ncbi:hypothetical protein NADFUDRAFT_51478 [Nadsonia fulvescens var. elongata DSM 6958]|uniref:C2H2-type domain-containing protein n=1 Tax=Nadsonia fulvescens var. elongata DSM 6958 TaxID=857566 RepID=A0A1E3PHN4_9ASCO|nr:hypothetical protein NADFUDRAFT_51478 [Nadsonia fulvescens var. elongata DSM 6958]
METKKFQCAHPNCAKSFNRRDYLVRHSANHLDVLPFKCSQCPQRFARADLLEKHLRTKSHEKRQKREQRKQEPKLQQSVPLATKSFPPQVQSQQTIINHINNSPIPQYSQNPPDYKPARKTARVSSTSSASSSSSSSSSAYMSTVAKSEASPFSSLSDSSVSSASEFSNSSNGAINPLGKSGHLSNQDTTKLQINPANYLAHQSSSSPLNTCVAATTIFSSSAPAHQKNHQQISPVPVPQPELFQTTQANAFETILGHHQQTPIQIQAGGQVQNLPNQQTQYVPYVSASTTSTPGFSFFSDFPDYSNANNSYAWLFGPDIQSDNLYSNSFGDSAIPTTTTATSALDSTVSSVSSHVSQATVGATDSLPLTIPINMNAENNGANLNSSGGYGYIQASECLYHPSNPTPNQSDSVVPFNNVQYSLYSGTTTVAPTPLLVSIPINAPSASSSLNPSINLANDKLNGLTPLTASILEQSYPLSRAPTPARMLAPTPIRTCPSTPLVRHKRVRNEDTEIEGSSTNNTVEEPYSVSHPISLMILDTQNSPINDILFDRAHHMSDDSATNATGYDERERRKHAESADFSLATLEQSLHTLVQEITRSRLLRALRYVPSVSADSAYFTKEALSRYLADFWRLFIPLYPIIHRATFRPSHARVELLIMMVSIGMTYHPDSECYRLSLDIQRHRRFHGAIMALVNDGDDQNKDDILPLWVLQCLILRNYFAKMLGSKAQFENCQVFHGSNIALMRLSGYFEGVKFPVWPAEAPTIGEENVFDPGHDYDLDFVREVKNANLAKFNAGTLSDDEDSGFDETEQMDEDPTSSSSSSSTSSLSWWQEWVRYESCKRVSYLAFICDTQHASLFRHSQVMSVFDMNLELPCSDACWYAESPRVLWHLYNQQPSSPERNFIAPWESIPSSEASVRSGTTNPTGSGSGFSVDKETSARFVESPQGRTETKWPSFLHGVKTLLSSYQHFSPGELSYSLDTQSQFSRSVLLYALISIGCDLKGRSHLDMGLVAKNKIDESKTRLVVGFMVWKGFYDRHLRLIRDRDQGAFVSLDTVISNEGPFGDSYDQNNPINIEFNDYTNANLLCANWAIHHIGLILMFSHASMLRMFSGASSWFPGSGRPHTRELLASQLAMNNWAASEDAKWAVWFSTQFLRRIFENQNIIYKADHVPWCVFLATLTIWCYQVCRRPQRDDKEQQHGGIFNPQRYFLEKIDGTGGYDHSVVKVDEALARKDAFAYLRMVESTPPQLADSSLVGANLSERNGNSARGPKSATHSWYDQDKASIGLVAYSYSIVQRSPRGLSGFICDKLLEAVTKFN